MYSRVILAQLQSGNVDELLEFLCDDVIPVAKERQGFKELLLLTDETINKE
jgi:hypothetical protein